MKYIAIFFMLGLAGCSEVSAENSKIKELEVKITALEASGGGRYQIVPARDGSGHIFLIDSKAGKIWEHNRFSDVKDAEFLWREMDILDESGEIGITLSEYIRIQSKLNNLEMEE